MKTKNFAYYRIYSFVCDEKEKNNMLNNKTGC